MFAITVSRAFCFQYGQELAKFVEDEKIPNLKVWTSMLERTIQTAQYINAPKAHWKALNEIDAVSESKRDILRAAVMMGVY